MKFSKHIELFFQLRFQVLFAIGGHNPSRENPAYPNPNISHETNQLGYIMQLTQRQPIFISASIALSTVASVQICIMWYILNQDQNSVYEIRGNGAFTNDVIILGGGGGLEKMTGGCWAKDDVTFLL